VLKWLLGKPPYAEVTEMNVTIVKLVPARAHVFVEGNYYGELTMVEDPDREDFYTVANDSHGETLDDFYFDVYGAYLTDAVETLAVNLRELGHNVEIQ
jgi:hypothetical protein